MSKTLVETPIKAAPVIVPEGGVDLRKAITVEVPFQALADRAKYLEDHVDILDAAFPGSSTDNGVPRFDGTDGKKLQGSTVVIADTTGDMSGVGKITYLTPRARLITIGAIAFQSAGPGDVTAKSNNGMICASDGAVVWVDLGAYLPDQGTITGWGVYVVPGAARAGANRILTRLWRTSAALAPVQLGSTTYDDTTTAPQLLIGGGSVSAVVARQSDSYTIEVVCGNDAATHTDSLIYAYVSITETGPGVGA